MTKLVAICGKSGTGKTLVAVHTAMALSYVGIKTLLVGCDQKQDTVLSLMKERGDSLMEGLERNNFAYDKLQPEAIVRAATPYLDVLELGPSNLLTGAYGGVLDEAFHYFQTHHLTALYQVVLFDVGDDRFDSAIAPLLRKAHWVIGVTTEAPESLFVLNRMVRAVLIGGHEFHFPARMLGVINNFSENPLAFNRYVEKTQSFPLLTLPRLDDLAALKPFHTTLFSLQKPPRHLDRLVDGFVKISDLLRGDPLNLYPMMPIPDEDIWRLPPPLARVKEN
ncbi:MAG: hypothetical protein OEV94_01595 [Deltaproteobacteria bacterium]|nr:hypothetical protein [Deltaproteobacteria bacterium]